MRNYIHDESCPAPTREEARRQEGKRALLAVVGLLALLIVGVWCGVAQAQTVTRQAVLTWTAPTACEGGTPIANCAVLGYSVQRLIGATWTEISVTTAAVLTYTDSNLPLGTHTYRVLATSDAGPSAPSNTATKTIDVPGRPGDIVITVTVTVTS